MHAEMYLPWLRNPLNLQAPHVQIPSKTLGMALALAIFLGKDFAKVKWFEH